MTEQSGQVIMSIEKKLYENFKRAVTPNSRPTRRKIVIAPFDEKEKKKRIQIEPQILQAFPRTKQGP